MYTGLSNDVSRLTNKRGFWLFVLNKTEALRKSTRALTLTPGLGINVVPSRVFYNQQKAPFSECTVWEDEEGNLQGERTQAADLVIANTSNAYSRPLCLGFCRQMYTEEYCGCRSGSSRYEIGNYDICLSPEEQHCERDFEVNVYRVGTFILEKCFVMCPLECTHRILNLALTQFRYPPSRNYANNTRQRIRALIHFNRSHHLKYLLEQNDFLSDLENNMVMFRLFYDELAYTQVCRHLFVILCDQVRYSQYYNFIYLICR